MTIEEFYSAIRSKHEPESFHDIKDQLTEDYFSLPKDERTLSRKTRYYLNYFIKANGRKWFPKTNWAALLLTPNWITYRGMYWLLYLLGLLGIFINELSLFELPYLLEVSLLVFIWVLVLLYSNAIYLQHVERRFKRGKRTPPSLVKGIFLPWLLIIAAGLFAGILFVSFNMIVDFIKS